MQLGNYDIVLLYSGGLDSLLAGAILAKQNLDVLAVKFIHPFSPGLWDNRNNSPEFIHHTDLSDWRASVGLDIIKIPIPDSENDEYFRRIINPRYGYGSNANPCLDCKICFMKRAVKIASQVNASGIATGEVLGQRPFSQRRQAIQLIERDAKVEKKVVRPLCAKHLPPSEMENSGLIDREKLYDFSGRGRFAQMQLAEKLGIRDYPSPASGCLLTDPGYSRRFFDALEHNEFSLHTSQLLKFGRHFRFQGTRIVVGRNEVENNILQKHFSSQKIMLEPISTKGPIALVELSSDDEIVKIAAEILARYCKEKDKKVEIRITQCDKIKCLSLIHI